MTPEPKLVEIHEQLIERGLVAPVARDAERRWSDFDLASLAENRLGDAADPRAIDEARRDDWRERATLEREALPSARPYERCYWLVEGGREVGTVSLATERLGSTAMRLSSLYVLPAERRRGVGRRVLEASRRAAAARGIALQLETAWTWQRSVRFYVRAGMWVRMWKHDLDLVFPACGLLPIVEIDDARAALSVEQPAGPHVLVEASREGDVLASFVARRDPTTTALREVAWDAESTLSLRLALAGWPLQRAGFGDVGPPEALARRIQTWEAFARHCGHRVDAPRIPGLGYPAWDARVR